MKPKKEVLIMIAMSTICWISSTKTALAADAYEPDNSRSAPVNIGVGSVQNHTIDPVGDVDWIRFYVPVTPVTRTYYVTITNTGTTSLYIERWVKLGYLFEIKYNAGTLPPGMTCVFAQNRSGANDKATFYCKFGVTQKSSLKGKYTIKAR